MKKDCELTFICQVADPVVTGETEWTAVLFHGQSFMLHQVTCAGSSHHM
jgi:tRNA U38,U39,U40 pseudouridine synthase TruA